MKSAFWITVIATTCTAPAYAQNMPVSTFLAKATALEAKGAFALFSSDMGILKREVRASAESYRTERKAAEASGHPPEVCLPAKGVSSTEMLKSFRAIPVTEQPRTTVKQAWIMMLKQRYPCAKPK
jgi:hypothetical protein